MRADRTEEERVAVGLCRDHTVYPDDSAGAGRVLDDHRLAEQFSHPHRHDAAHNIERAARRIGHHHGDRA
jgi:hypothetical protein